MKQNKKNTYVRIHADLIESGARDQIKKAAESPAFRGQIAIMPDVHQGAGCVIGFTGKFSDKVIPNIIGVDIGCGVVCYPLGYKELPISFEDVDEKIRTVVPLGFNSRQNISKFMREYEKVDINIANQFIKSIGKEKDSSIQLGSLGGGNHFIEIAKSDVTGELHLLVHSGSRNLGQTIALHYQKEAVKFCKEVGVFVDRDLEYLPLNYGGGKYIEYMKLAQRYASANRRIMVEHILEELQIVFDETKLVESVHNFIAEDNIVRKGAIQANKGQKVIIPFNMAEGSILGVGKGNKDYNNSAPHGAGRTGSRSKMKQQLVDGVISLEMFKEKMEGVFSTCIDDKRIDESPMAYKPVDSIIRHLEETVEITERLKPVYNLKG